MILEYIKGGFFMFYIVVKRMCIPIAVAFLLIPQWVHGEDVVHVNQVGYLTESAKFVLVSHLASTFEVIEVESGDPVFEGNLQLWRDADPSTGINVYRGDFSQLEQSGSYYIRTSEGNESYPFTIGDNIYDQAYRMSLKNFYFQRCGMSLGAQYAGEYHHGTCHSTDGFFHDSSGESGFQTTRGGWHDAGDYGKYIVNAGITVGTLLMANEYFPGRFGQDDIDIPESENGIPDILDEIRYELEWMLTMQSESGGLFHKLTREQFSPFILPENDTGKRYIYEVSTTATGDFAAVMARAARMFTPYDPAFSQSCLDAAVQAWSFLEANPLIVPSGGFHNPPGTVTGQYGDSRDWDERLWAAAELYMTTGEAVYHAYYLDQYDQHDLISGPMSWPDVEPLAHLTYLLGEWDDINTSVQADLGQSLDEYCQELVNERNASGFHVLLKPGQYNWGCHSAALNKAILLIVGFHESGNEAYFNAAFDQLHYILGVNAHAMSFLTGVGTVSPMHPHHRPSGADGIEEPVPGLLAGGPNQYLQDNVLSSHFDFSTPPALCYIDDEGSYASNENCINWNAPLVFVVGYFNGGVCSGRTGDVNGDGEVDVIDVITVVNHVLEIATMDECGQTQADTNGDGVINIIDVIEIVNIILGQ